MTGLDVGKSQKIFRECEQQFRATFGKPLAEFWDVKTLKGIVLGFDIVAFDDQVVKSGDESMSDAVAKAHGPEAADLVRRLIS